LTRRRGCDVRSTHRAGSDRDGAAHVDSASIDLVGTRHKG
jgi:hypothetical protein